MDTLLQWINKPGSIRWVVDIVAFPVLAVLLIYVFRSLYLRLALKEGRSEGARQVRRQTSKLLATLVSLTSVTLIWRYRLEDLAGRTQASVEQREVLVDWLGGAVNAVIATVILVLLLLGIGRAFKCAVARLDAWREARKGVQLQGTVLITPLRVRRFAVLGLRIVRFCLTIALLYFYVPLVLSFIPATRSLAGRVMPLLLGPAQDIGLSVVRYLPRLISMILVVIEVRYSLKFSTFIMAAVGKGQITIPGIDHDSQRIRSAKLRGTCDPGGVYCRSGSARAALPESARRKSVILRLRLIVAPILVATACMISSATTANAQDTHYWTLQYGPRSSLLGGAVIGSVDDVSATFYNPGALSLASDLAFAVSTDVFEVTGVILKGGGGEGVDLGNTKSGLRPSMIAGTIKEGLLGGGGILAYSVLTRARGTQDLAGVLLLSGADLPPELDLDEAVGGVSFTGRFNDFWGGLTYSQALGEHFGLGVTWYGAVRSQERRREAIGQLIGTDGSGSAEIDIASGSYTVFRTLFRVGAFAATGPVTGGLTLTTPSIHLSGSGDLLFNESVFGTDIVALAAGVQTDLAATYKNPLSVGAGLAWRIGNARLHGSAEWFDAIEPYFVMQGEDVVAQEPADRLVELDAVQEQAEVLNWALGLEYALSPKVSAYLSYYTDNSTLTDEVERAALGILPFDIRNVSLGTDFVVKSARLTLGLGFGWGSKVDQELTDLLRQEDPDFEATYVFRSIKLLFGFEIGVD